MGQGAQGHLLGSRTPPSGKEAFLSPTDLPQGWQDGLIHGSRRRERQHLFTSPLGLTPCPSALQISHSCCGQGRLLLLLLWSGPSLKHNLMPPLQDEHLGKYLESGHD